MNHNLLGRFLFLLLFLLLGTHTQAADDTLLTINWLRTSLLILAEFAMRIAQLETTSEDRKDLFLV